ncbi:MAG: vanadium-dependent haloperoxidase [Pseudonocardiaceae bacterium]
MLSTELVPATSDRVFRATAVRSETTAADAFLPAPAQVDNGDEARYPDKSGTYTKGILQSGIGIVDPAAYETFKRALSTGAQADFNKIILGGPRTLNGPQGGLAFYLDSLDASQFVVPPAPALQSEAYATELIELYWASMLRDVAFTDYAGNGTATDAAAELTALHHHYAGPRDATGNVTPALLFRGPFVGETDGPYISQFLLQPTALGALPIDQKYKTFPANADFVTTDDDFQKVQNGQVAQSGPASGPTLYLHDGRGLAAYTHDDVLYQAYFIAYLVLNTLKCPQNPGNPYIGSKIENGFATLGQPDIAATLAAVANEALKAVWYQKWFVHLRHRPESGGAIVALIKTGRGDTIDGNVSSTVLDSNAVKASFAANNNSYYLSQAFPEGSPTHPAYPTGHGTVAGACITALKFFFDGSFTIPAPVMPTADGTSLSPYAAPVGHGLTVNGELNKLAHNISFGHGIHAGIHWRSDTDTSIQLGEAIALSYLQDRAHTYNEKFEVSLQKVDGTTVTISHR